MSSSKEFRPTPDADAWKGESPATPWPKAAVGSITLPDGGRVPTYYCVRCEAKAAVEGRPTTTEMIAKYGAQAVVHICFTCGYDREVDAPADLKGET